MKPFRLVPIVATLAMSPFSLPHVSPVLAAQQSATAGAETTSSASATTQRDAGAVSYAGHCAICHGEQREGNLPGFPPLVGVQHRMTEAKIAALIHSGKGRMPAFPSLQDGELKALLAYLTRPALVNTAQSGEDANLEKHNSGLAAAGGALFLQNCAFCHGRDAMGGETGPDLTQSKLVLADKTGEKIAGVVREGRPDNKMPSFNFSSQEISSLVAFIHARVAAAESHKGSRRGVSVADLQTGNAAAGKAYFNGAGGCAKCHSPSGDLAGIASRYQGLQLEERMLYPRGAKSTLTVTLASGQKITGILAYRDEFTVGMRDSSGTYRSWSTNRVHFHIDSPADAHVEQFPKYTDADVHNLMAYLQTLR